MKSAAKKTYLHVGIAFVLFVLCMLIIKPVNGLTDVGVRTIAVTVATLYLWLTLNTHWTSILFLGLLVVVGAMTPTAVWAGSMGHFSVITMIVFMALNYCLTQTGVIDKVCNWFITRKVVTGRPYVFIGMFFASMLVLGMVMDNLSLAVIYVGIAEILCAKIGVKKGDPFYTCMFMGIMWVDVVISIASPIAHAPCLILMSMMSSQLGITVSYAQWLGLGIPFAIIMFIVIMICVRVWHPDATAYKNYDVEAERKAAPKLSTAGKIASIVFILAVLMMIVPELLKSALPAFATYWTGVGVIVIAILACAILCVIHVDNKPVLDMPGALKSLPMGAIIFAGVVCVMSTPISSETTGISVWLSTSLQSVFAGVSPWVVVVILTVASIIMTNFLSNVVTMTIFFQIGVALLSGGSVNMGVFSMLIGIASAMATLTPSACAPMPLIFGPGHVTMKNTFKVNLVFIVLSLVVMFAFVVPVAPSIIG